MSEAWESPLPYLLTEAADNDLLEIGLYLRLRSRRAAEKFVRDVEKTLDLLSRFPEMGRSRDEFAPRLRSFTVGSYVLFYRVTMENQILVIRVVHGMRDLFAIFGVEENRPN